MAMFFLKIKKPNARMVKLKVGATIPCAATGEKYALPGAVRVEV